MRKVPVFRPLLEQEERDAAVAAIDLGWLGMGSYVAKLEEGLSDYLGLKAAGRHIALVNTGHSALHLALLIAGVGPGDEVITPSFNCVSDFQAVLSCGAEVVLCDVQDDTLCMDVEKAEALVTPRTKAIIVTDYGNTFADHEAVQAFAARHKLRVVHDAAHTMGSRYKGQMVGTFSDITMLSFDPVKVMTCLDGGAVIVKSEEELKRLHELRLLGMGQPASVMYQNKRAWTFHCNELGFRYHMVNMHAAIGLAQLGKIERIGATRRASCQYYMDRFAGLQGLGVPVKSLDGITPFIFYVRVPAALRTAFRDYLMERGVDTGIHWQPGHSFGIMKDARRGDLSVTYKAVEEIVTLPLHSAMSQEDMQQVADAVISFFDSAARRDAA
jgi:dTDP-4-amino-4,6-dideoxygalactose transaminase